MKQMTHDPKGTSGQTIECPCGGWMVFKNTLVRNKSNAQDNKKTTDVYYVFICPKCKSTSLSSATD